VLDARGSAVFAARHASPSAELLERQSGRWDSNPRHLAWEASALPTELRPRALDSTRVSALPSAADASSTPTRMG
jgi:hypothetical protein